MKSKKEYTEPDDLELIDLDAPTGETPDTDVETEMEEETEKRPLWRKLLSPHLLFLLALIGIGTFIFLRFSNWGQSIDLDEFFAHNEVEIQEDILDTILPLLDEDGQKVLTKTPPTILFFGNSPLAPTEDSKSVVDFIQEETNATVYNFAIKNSYMASHSMNYYLPDSPLDPFCPYWMLLYMTLKDNLPYDYHDLPSMLGEKLPAEFPSILAQMDTIDMSTVDVITFMYDGLDYLLGNPAYNDDNYTDVTTFNGNLEAAIEIVQNNYPHIRIIVMSPTYAYAIDENGNYISSDLKAYRDNFVLSSFVTREGFSATSHGVTFVDNLYGTITEDNASDYLIDFYQLNEKGKKLVADRFVYALNYYSEK